MQWAALLALSFTCACAEIPNQRYGVESLKFSSTEKRELNPDALRACVATEQREKLTLGLGALASPTCGQPPFDEIRRSARLFALPWTDWPIYDEAVLKLDLDRIERWYQARGYYGVRVLDVAFKPTEARASDACQPGKDKDGKEKDCTVEITVKIDEGEPVRLRKVVVEGDEQLPPKFHEELLDALDLEQGDIFDEALYDESRERMANVLREEGYARAAIVGDVVVNRGLLVADITIRVTPGPLCYISDVQVVREVNVPTAPVLAATMMRKGQVYRPSVLEDAQRSIYGLGAFSSVTVQGRLDRGSGPDIPVEIDLEPRRQSQIMVGAGIQAGTVSSGVAAEEAISVPQWDVHLLGSYEHRNFFGGLRRFRAEERPRMLFLDSFPNVPDGSPRFGNTITVNFSQPGVIDPRTNLFVETRWDNGPDPFLLFFRNDVGLAVGLERGFWKQRLSARVALHQDIMQVAGRQPLRKKIDDLRGDNPPLCEGSGAWTEETPYKPDPACLYEQYLIPSSYRLFFVEQRVSLDLRDDAANPSKGGYFRVSAHEAVRLWDPSWNYIRLTPEARGYAPIGAGIILAGRFALGSLHVLSKSNALDQQAQVLGAQSYRLRGGGANSVRGFGPGELGEGRSGGIRRWEGSLELRVPLSKNFYIVGFGDVGDVYAGFKQDSRGEPVLNAAGEGIKDVRFRFDHLNTSVGGGLRYRTVIGPIRLDVGYRPKALAGAYVDNATMDLGFTKFRGAVHLTIGESF